MEKLQVKQRKTKYDDRHFIVTDGTKEFRFSVDKDFNVLLHLGTSNVPTLTYADVSHRTKIKDLFED